MGLSYAWDLGIGCGSLLQHLNALRQRPWIVRLQHVLRTRNLVADLLAKRATRSDFEMHFVSDPDATLRQMLQSDMDVYASHNISEFQDKSRKRSLDVFGHIDKRKNQILARLKGIEKALERRANPFLIELEISLKRELDKILEQEESLWFQRARTKWIQWGDRNTTYFHATTLSRRRRNHINMLHLPDGSWSNDHTILKEHAIDFFRTLLTSEARNSWPTSQPGNFFQFDNSSMQHANTSSAPVAVMVDNNGGWDWIRLKQWLPQDAVAKIAAIKPPRSDAGADTPGWRWGKSRTFTVRSAYQAIHTPSTTTNETHWSKIWRLPVPQRIRVFMWLVFRQRLLTNAERFRRHLTLSDSCPLCHSAPETIDHMLRTCPRARHGWEAVIRPSNLDAFLSLPFSEWL
ncbi:hypothetical protein GQ457_07G017880 [Hibiscus cannabinus]